MRKRLLLNVIFIGLLAGICRGERNGVMFFSPAQLEESVSTHADNFDYLLIDIRDPFEVAGGIIASRFCRPYHMSWNYGELEDNYLLLPDTMRILLYCQTGNRAMDAANFLSGKGYELLGCLTNGVRAYTGELRDSTEFKPLSLLPEPSYFGDTALSVFNSRQSLYAVTPADENREVFTLQGRIVRQFVKQKKTPAFLLIRRDGRTTRAPSIGNKISGAN